VAPVKDFVMLSNYSHVMLNGTRVYLTAYLGLDWTDLEAPVPIEQIGTDEEGHLLALSADSFWQWSWQTKGWTEREALPLGVSDWTIFHGQLYVLADGQVYQEIEDSWHLVAIEGAERFIDMAYQYPDSLWLMDENGSLWRQRLTELDWLKQ
jgi:hypothetical protein